MNNTCLWGELSKTLWPKKNACAEDPVSNQLPLLFLLQECCHAGRGMVRRYFAFYLVQQDIVLAMQSECGMWIIDFPHLQLPCVNLHSNTVVWLLLSLTNVMQYISSRHHSGNPEGSSICEIYVAIDLAHTGWHTNIGSSYPPGFAHFLICCKVLGSSNRWKYVSVYTF